MNAPLTITGQLALVLATLFTGGCLHVSLVEHRLRLLLDTSEAVAQWRAGADGAFALQAPMAIASALLAAVTWMHGGHGLYLAGAIVMALNWPITLALLGPIEVQLRAPRGLHPAAANAHLVQWGRIHAVRTAMGACAAALMFVAAFA